MKPISTLLRPASLAAPLALVALATPLTAQEASNERVNMVTVYAEDECPEPTQEGELVICEIVVEAERYRIPSTLRTSSSPENRSWAQRVESIRYIGDFGTMSCDPAGAGGFTGCTQKMINEAYAERAESENIRFSQLIEQQRQERLSTIDQDAAAEQERVEQIEREYMERLERERDAPLPGEDELPAPTSSPAPASPPEAAPQDPGA
ncbi:MAG: hypothetical protein AAFY07_12230 [Pseudomonadota bacterium]